MPANLRYLRITATLCIACPPTYAEEMKLDPSYALADLLDCPQTDIRIEELTEPEHPFAFRPIPPEEDEDPHS